MLGRLRNLQRLGPAVRRALTLGTGVAVAVEADAVINRGEVLVIRKGGPHTHAPVEPAAAEGAGGSAASQSTGVLLMAGACGAVLLAAGGFWAALRRRRQQDQGQQQQLEQPQELPFVKAMPGTEAYCQPSPASSHKPGERAGLLDSVGEHPSSPGGGSCSAAASPRAPPSAPPTLQHSPLPLGKSAALLPPHPADSPLSAQALRPTPFSNRTAASSIHGEDGWLASPSRQDSAASSEGLLSRLPSEDWQACALDPADIHFCHNSDGSLVELGRGAFSTVYRVLLGGVEPHAAKVLQLGEDERLQDEFIKEASLFRTLRHRNIPTFAGVCVAKGCGYIVMELMEGRDLHSRLSQRNKAGERVFGWYSRGKTVALDVARALHYLHCHNLIHLDVKSSNVLLTRDFTAKLADVGLTRALYRTHYSFGSGTPRPGTWDYMAPELLMGRHCTNAVDVYSFGVLLYEICTGKHPCRGSLRELRVPEECPAEVAALCLECLSEDPAGRPSARELVARLSHLQCALGSQPSGRE